MTRLADLIANMIIGRNILVVALFILFIIPEGASGPIRYSKPVAVDKTLSPYFFVDTEDPGLDQLPLKHTSAEVKIVGVIADVHVSQVYVNEGIRTIEAVYVFPGSTKAAVYSMEMAIGDRLLQAKIERREKARQQYEQAKDEGKTASLLEQQRPNVFQMNVANIMPGDSVIVHLRYTELLVPEDGIYEFVYPTVVGPRYSNQPLATASSGEMWVQNPYQSEGERPYYTFDLSAQIIAGLPIKEAVCTSHDVAIQFNGTEEALVDLDGNAFSGNRDFILRYRLTGSHIQSGMLMYKGEKENYFLTMVQPPKRIAVDQIPPREYIFIVDVSGSMNGFPIDISKRLLKDLIGNLRPTDRFNVLLFAGGSKLMSSESVNATKDNIEMAIQLIENQRGGGGTELLPALNRALQLPGNEGVSRTVVIATDGYVSVEKEAFDVIRQHLGDANFFTFGIGSSVNRFLLEGLARIGQGEPFVITSAAEAGGQAKKFREYIQSPVLTDIKIDFGELEVYDVEPYSIPDVLSDRPVVVFGKWRGQPKGELKVSGVSGSSSFTACLDIGSSRISEDNQAVRYLWARKRIQLLDDYGALGKSKENIEAVTELGIRYNLLTAYTSFIAIDSVVRGDGQMASVRQPLPLPKGVSNNAVGGNSTHSHSYLGNGRTKSRGDTYRSMPMVIPEESVVEDGESEGVIELPAQFPGGQDKLQLFIMNNMQYPESARKQGIQGTVYIEFEVDARGNVINVLIKRGVYGDLDIEAVRVVKMMPKWIPGMQNGQPGKTKVILPIRFTL